MAETPASASSETTPIVRAPKLAQRLIVDFTEQIRDGKLKAGSKLPTEHEIMRSHGVSRAVVREAISRLHAAGLVEARQGVGTFVLEPAKEPHFRIDPSTVITMRDVLLLLELRISFETESAYLAAIRHTPVQLKKIHDCVERIQKILESGSEMTKAADFEFHLAIAEATGNRYFTQILNHLGLSILPRARVDVRYISQDNAMEYLGRSNREHRDIYQAIARRDADGARAAMRIHLSNSRERLQQLYEAAEARAAESQKPA